MVRSLEALARRGAHVLLALVLSVSMTLTAPLTLVLAAMLAPQPAARAAAVDPVRLQQLFVMSHDYSLTETAATFISGGGDGAFIVRAITSRSGELRRIKSVTFVSSADESWFVLSFTPKGRPSRIIDSSGNTTVFSRFSARYGQARITGIGPDRKKLAPTQTISFGPELVQFTQLARKLSSLDEFEGTATALHDTRLFSESFYKKMAVGGVLAKFALDAIGPVGLGLGIITLAGVGWVPLIVGSAIASSGILVAGFTALDTLSNGQLGTALPGVKDAAEEYSNIAELIGYIQTAPGVLSALKKKAPKAVIQELWQDIAGKVADAAIKVGQANGATTTGSFQAVLVPDGGSYYVRATGTLTHNIRITISGTDGYSASFTGLGSVTTGQIPKGAGGVTDTATVTDETSGESRTLSFTF